jgi:pyruvyl transferase EpsI
MSTLRKKTRTVRHSIKFVARLPVRIPVNIHFALRHMSLRKRRKIIYTITPPPKLKNIGDHAQATAILAWTRKHYPGLPVIEMDKDKARYFLPALRWLVQPQDLILLHSGGNLGDRGLWSEKIRRLIISTFPRNKIVSLPQTINFSDTQRGKTERENSRRIYNAHTDLTVIGRDPQSGKLAGELFPNARTFSMPDFVLSLPPYPSGPRNDPPRILLCLRNDDESILTAEEHEELTCSLSYQCSYFDTSFPEQIKIEEREAVLKRTLDFFYSFDAVITDRYHGIIFSVLCKKPCIVLRTVDHKLVSALEWFREIPFILFAEDREKIPSLVEQALSIESREVPDWNTEYFDRLPGKIKYD